MFFFFQTQRTVGNPVSEQAKTDAGERERSQVGVERNRASI
jgi:hypothetical protein